MTEKAKSNGSELASPLAHHDGADEFVHGGLTKRELFASKALQGILANPNRIGKYSNELVQDAVEFADQLLEELSKTSK
jgi:hypothetical protein